MGYRTSVSLTVAPLLLVAACGRAPREADTPPPPDYPDAAALEKYRVAPVSPKRDAKTGFVVGGRNDTALIGTLTEINGRPIADLERDMRPGAKGEVGSTAGFLGPAEGLLEVMAADNRYVVDELGLTHQELAKHLHAMAGIGRWLYDQRKDEGEVVYQGRRYKVGFTRFKGYQESPFLDGTRSDSDVTVENLETGKRLWYGRLLADLIERYGFYEGKGTRYRVEPGAVLEVFDFLEAKKR